MNSQRANSQRPKRNHEGHEEVEEHEEFFFKKSFFLFVFFILFVFFVVKTGAQAPEKITEVRVHGNHTTPDADILRLSGLTTGADASEAQLKEAERKLKATHRFEGVELRKRYLSITDPSQVLVMIVVDEHPAVSASDLTPGPFKKLRAMQMWMPILKNEDGYGFTYGARLAFKDSLGDRSRVSVPMTWGGERRIGLEAERSFDGPISIVRGGVALYRRVNPFFEVPDRRTEARVEADRIFASWFRAGVDARVANVEFGPDYEARHSAAGVHTVCRHADRSVVSAQRDPHADRMGAAALWRVRRPLEHGCARIHRRGRVPGAGAAGAADQGRQQPAVRGAEPARRQRQRARVPNRPPRRRQPVCHVGRAADPAELAADVRPHWAEGIRRRRDGVEHGSALRRCAVRSRHRRRHLHGRRAVHHRSRHRQAAHR